MIKYMWSLIIVFLFMVNGFSLTLSYHDLSGKLSHSPDQVILDHKKISAQSEIRNELKWNNPEFEWEREELDGNGTSEVETSFLLGKSISMPWALHNHRKALGNALDALESGFKSDSSYLVMDYKLLYIKLVLLQQYMQKLSTIQNSINKTLDISFEQYDQGLVSGMDNRFVQLSRYQIQSQYIDVESQYNYNLNRLKQQLGLDRTDDLFLNTLIDYQPVKLPEFNSAQALLADHPDMQMLALNSQSNKYMLSYQKMQPFSSVHVSGGYKYVGTELEGYVAGIALPLPLFNQNRKLVQKYQAEYYISQIRYDFKIKTMTDNLFLHYNTVGSLQQILQTMQANEIPVTIIDDLLYSYYQGSASLGDVLGGLEAYMDSLTTWHEQLYHYYENILAIEYLLQSELVKFEGDDHETN